MSFRVIETMGKRVEFSHLPCAMVYHSWIHISEGSKGPLDHLV